MGDERQMTDDGLAQVGEEVEGELDLDSEGSEDLDSAIEEALEAVEKASQTARAKAESGDGIQPPGAARASTANGVEIGRLEEEIADLKDRSTRTLADFENFRRRVDRERQEDRRYAAFDILREFLSVVDNLERALASEGPTDDLKVGVELIHRQMQDLMKNAGVERVSAVGKEFDPRFHEAVTHHEDQSVSVPTVSDELQAGYVMYDRLLRPSVVRVAMPPEGENDVEGDK